MSDHHGKKDEGRGGGGGGSLRLFACVFVFASVAIKSAYIITSAIMVVCTGPSKQPALTSKHESQSATRKENIPKKLAPSPSKETVSIASTRPKSGNAKCMIVMGVRVCVCVGGGGSRG